MSIAISIASHTSDEKMGTAQYEIPHILMYEPRYEQVDVCVEVGGDALREGVNGFGRRSFDAGCNGEGETRDQLPKGKKWTTQQMWSSIRVCVCARYYLRKYLGIWK